MLTFLCPCTRLPESSFASFGREHLTSARLFRSACVQPPEFLRKSLKPVAAFLRRKAIRVLIYLDDFLLLAAPVERAVKNTQLVVSLLQSLGFSINHNKSLLIPTQAITFLGFQIDSTRMMLSLPAEKTDKIVDCCRRLLVSHGIHIAKPSKLNRFALRDRFCRPQLQYFTSLFLALNISALPSLAANYPLLSRQPTLFTLPSLAANNSLKTGV